MLAGIITSKSGELEKKDDISAGWRRPPVSCRWSNSRSPAMRLRLSTEEGNFLAEEEQWAKLKLAVDVANEVWGK